MLLWQGFGSKQSSWLRTAPSCALHPANSARCTNPRNHQLEVKGQPSATFILQNKELWVHTAGIGMFLLGWPQRGTAEDGHVKKKKSAEVWRRENMFSVNPKSIPLLSSRFHMLAPFLSVKNISRIEYEDFKSIYVSYRKMPLTGGPQFLEFLAPPLCVIHFLFLCDFLLSKDLFHCSEPHFLWNKSCSQNTASASLLLSVLFTSFFLRKEWEQEKASMLCMVSAKIRAADCWVVECFSLAKAHSFYRPGIRGFVWSL